MGFFDKLKKINIFSAFGFGSEVDDDFYDELEEALILADAGMDTAVDTVELLRRRVKQERIKTVEEARGAMCDILTDLLSAGEGKLNLDSPPAVVLFIGVNGVGKTTTIGKIGHQLKEEGKKVLLCAADTFRAAAADQLTIWAERSNLEIIKQHEGADPAAVVFDATTAARARKADVVLVDTAGRLHNKQNLMNELNKISRVLDRELLGSSRETLLVLDATTGQNGLVQAKQFKEAAGITGIVLTKLDGTAKGGIALAIAKELGLPVKYAGVGEGIDDLKPFDPKEFAQALI
ncbi:MAG: signal recognition particle-docking protein FtsY [Ruminococcaceae bacterium]|nr:signal recognition particle-docking protein FtsY [Oscillospiraceae bacterium]